MLFISGIPIISHSLLDNFELVAIWQIQMRLGNKSEKGVSEGTQDSAKEDERFDDDGDVWGA